MLLLLLHLLALAHDLSVKVGLGGPRSCASLDTAFIGRLRVMVGQLKRCMGHVNDISRQRHLVCQAMVPLQHSILALGQSSSALISPSVLLFKDGEGHAVVLTLLLCTLQLTCLAALLRAAE